MMEKNYILIRYSEIALKKGNRKRFEKQLISNIRETLRGNIKKIIRYQGRIVVIVTDVETAIDKLSKIFGIKSISPAVYYRFRDLEDLLNFAADYFKKYVNNRKFKVECNRVGNHNFTSYNVKKLLGEKLSKYGTVDIKNPEIIVYLEIRDNDAYLFTDVYKGPGGLPIGSEGKVLALVSGGFDSPVAAWFIMKRGCCVDVMYCNLGGEIEEYYVLNTVNKLVEWSNGYNTKIYVLDCRTIVEKIMENVKSGFWLIVFRRILYTLGERLALKINAKALVTGESLGQKSSQTLDNLYSAEYGIKIPVFRPLIGFDKDEIINISRKIGLYEYSEKVPEFCAILSEKPMTKSTKEEVEKEFKKVEEYLKDIKIRVYDKLSIKNRLVDLEKSLKTYGLGDINLNEYEIIYIGKLTGLLNIPKIRVMSYTDAKKYLSTIDKNKKVLLVCRSGVSVYDLAKEYSMKGYHIKAMDEKTLRKLLKDKIQQTNQQLEQQ
ncbi:MAG TPA: tRNA 4-thiouridine(8) synthase ThiI [Candidatus Nanopusillus sp.]|nr:tRNA 4-thiouridine(8) synthase ThiI [Candidatus Nanopusillus sp.]